MVQFPADRQHLMELRFDTGLAGQGDFRKNFVVMLALILGLLGLNLLPSLAGQGQNRLRIQKFLAGMKNGDLNREDFDALTAGYYEGLQKNASHLGMPAERDDVSFRNDFLLYEFKPNVKRQYPAGMRITNSLGMP